MHASVHLPRLQAQTGITGFYHEQSCVSRLPGPQDTCCKPARQLSWVMNGLEGSDELLLEPSCIDIYQQHPSNAVYKKHNSKHAYGKPCMVSVLPYRSTLYGALAACSRGHAELCWDARMQMAILSDRHKHTPPGLASLLDDLKAVSDMLGH